MTERSEWRNQWLYCSRCGKPGYHSNKFNCVLCDGCYFEANAQINA